MRLNNKLKILIKSTLSYEDMRVLTLLYQPLASSEAISLYLTMYHLTNQETGVSDELIHQDIYDILNIKTSEFMKLREKLEALGLLLVLEKDDYYLYKIKSPLSSKAFLKDTIFGSYLLSEIGEKNLEMLVSLFRLEKVSEEGFKNITKSFNDVYEIKELDLLDIKNNLRGGTYNGGSTISNIKFDYDKFVGLMPQRYQKAHLFNPSFKENIERIAFIYKFNEADLYEIYIRSSKKGEMPADETLRLQANIYYTNVYGKVMPEIVVKNLDEAEKLDRVSPTDIIMLFSKRENKGADLATVMDFSSRNDAPQGVLNAILMFVIKNKEGILPNLAYLEKVLNTWQNKGVKTTKDALEYSKQLEEEYANYQASYQKRRNKSKGVKSEWLDDFMKDYFGGES